MSFSRFRILKARKTPKTTEGTEKVTWNGGKTVEKWKRQIAAQKVGNFTNAVEYRASKHENKNGTRSGTVDKDKRVNKGRMKNWRTWTRFDTQPRPVAVAGREAAVLPSLPELYFQHVPRLCGHFFSACPPNSESTLFHEHHLGRREGGIFWSCQHWIPN